MSLSKNKLFERRLRRELQRAYADEWFGHYNYLHAASLLSRLYKSTASHYLRQKSDLALGRAQQLGQRLFELGEEPVSKLTDLPKMATNKPFKLPRRRTDAGGILAAVVDAEKTSLKTYRHLHGIVYRKDPVTTRLIFQLLQETSKSKKALQKLRRDF